MLRWYQLQLKTRPLLTQSISTAILFATGDTLAQHFVERPSTTPLRASLSRHDVPRTLRMASYGGLVFGPAATTWYNVLSRVRIANQANSVPTILARVGLDQTVFASCNLALFLSSMGVMEGGGKEGAKRKLEQSYWMALSRNWMVWPWVQIVNFRLVPLEHRVLVVNVVSIGWNCYLSYLNSGGGGGTAKKAE